MAIHDVPEGIEHIVDGVCLEVEMSRGDVEVVIVVRGVRIGRDDVQEPGKVTGIPEVCECAQVDDGIGVGRFGRQVGCSLQLEVLFDGAVPGVTRRVVIVDVRFVPDDPVIDSPLIAVDGFGHKRRPGVVGVIRRQVEPARQAPAVAGPLWNADEQTDHLAPGSQLVVQRFIVQRRLPVVGPVGLHFGPLEARPRPGHAETAGRGRILEAFDDAKSPVRDGRGRSDGRRFWGGRGIGLGGKRRGERGV